MVCVVALAVGARVCVAGDMNAERPGLSPRVASTSAAGASTRSVRVMGVGRSVNGRAIVARVVGDVHAGHRILVVGCVHGDETAGIAISRFLRYVRPPRGVALWLVDAFNPDGRKARRRQNAHGVDLNRNSPTAWRPLTGRFYSGPRPFSEPESQAIRRLVMHLRPTITVWYHQHASLVDDSGGQRATERAYARAVGLPFRHYGNMPGSITSWQNATFPRATAFVVELPAGRLSTAATARHANALLTLTAR